LALTACVHFSMRQRSPSGAAGVAFERAVTSPLGAFAFATFGAASLAGAAFAAAGFFVGAADFVFFSSAMAAGENRPSRGRVKTPGRPDARIAPKYGTEAIVGIFGRVYRSNHKPSD
jgi:hypothetical protein